jgi:beta-N-acetylhexosaminidase
MKAIKAMTAEEKAGQLFVTGINGTEMTDYIREVITEWKVSGLVFSIRNMENPFQVRDLISNMQKLALKENGIPLIITINQEGGDRTTFLESLSRNPGNMAVGATHNPAWAYKVAKMIGTELKSLGFNMMFTPDLDINIDAFNPGCGIRSFGDRPELVAAMAEQYIKGQIDAKIASTAKHFPGKGDSNIDAHFDLPDIPHSMERLDQVELVPFKKAVEENTAAIMTSHVRYSAIDKDAIGTFSKVINTDLARIKLNFNNVIITDAFGMKGLTNYYPMGESAVQVILAGGDMILKRHGRNSHLEILNALRKAIKDGRISEERVNQSLERILTLKKQYCSNKIPRVKVSLWNNENIKKLESMCEDSVTLLRNDEHLLPLKLKSDMKVLLIMPDTLANASLDGIPGDRSCNIIRGLLSDIFTYSIDKFDEVLYRIKPYSEEIKEVINKVKNYDLLIFGTHRSNIRSKQVELVKAVFNTGKKTIWIALNTPYDLLDFPDAKTYICTYGDRLPQLKALCRIIAGTITPKGRLPVSIPGLHKFGEGMTDWTNH